MNARSDRLHHASNESEASWKVTATLKGKIMWVVLMKHDSLPISPVECSR